MTHPMSPLRALIAHESAGGVVLMLAAVLAMLAANSPLSLLYFGVLHAHAGPLSVEEWINDGLMALFFLLVGLELKREALIGQLATWPRRILPGLAALGGMIAPAVVYVALTAGDPAALKGWAIPSATDIAFTLGVMALLGARVPVSLKVFVTALAIVDDLGAIVIIAVFYTASLAPLWLALSLALLTGLALLNRAGVTQLWPYLLIGGLLWVCVLNSGIHATLAGVATALAIPLKGHALERLEHGLSPWVGFLIVPVFGFANAGVSFAGLGWEALVQPVTLGVTLGLFLGKQIGILLATWAAVHWQLAHKPSQASWGQIYGVSLLSGIGFTMSIFIGLLAFPGAELLQSEVKIGVLLGSGLSALCGAGVLVVARHKS